MLSNNLYNLMMQMTAEHVSLWRIKKEYLKDAKGDKESLAFWRTIAKEKEAHIEQLQKLIAKKIK